MKPQQIAVSPIESLGVYQCLFDLLRKLYPVEFRPWDGRGASFWDGLVLLKTTRGELDRVQRMGLNCLAVAPMGGLPIQAGHGAVDFGKSTCLDACFRGQRMFEQRLEEAPVVDLMEGDELICSLNSKPYWALRPAGRAAVNVVALAPPEVQPGQTVYDHFNRLGWLQILPYFHFLKQATSPTGWQPPPLRACFMFDDPNLHWRSYGFIDFLKLARHAEQSGCHVAFAMVPMDAWFAQGSVARLFKKEQRNVSLCMHGVDHTDHELGSSLGKAGFTQLFARGLRWVNRFEQRYRLRVARVMVPPYGAFNEEAAAPLLRLGYDAACVSRASLSTWNKQRAWPASYGHSVVEFIDGLPVIPRQVMAAGHEGSYRLAAFLNQPIIPHGHHQDCAGGLDLLAQAANAINSLGPVIWMDMASLNRSNYLTRRVGDVVFVKMLARRITLEVGPTVKEIVVERPWLSGDGFGESLICRQGGTTCSTDISVGPRATVSLPGEGVLELISPPETAVDFRQVQPVRPKVWPIVRRVLSEVRDRLAPLRARLRGNQAVPSGTLGEMNLRSTQLPARRREPRVASR